VDTCTRNVLSICSGYGGIELGLGVVERTRTVCYVENEISVTSILAARMEDGSLDSAPVWSNLRTFDPEPWRGKVDIIAGGFPCQPFSVAGAKRGADDNRNLWPEVERIARGLDYPTLFLENVTGVLGYHYKTIRPSLQEMGYTVKEGLFTAAETGAPHKRQRLFILAYTESERHGRGDSPQCGDEQRFIQSEESGGSEMGSEAEGCDSKLADSEHQRPVQPEPQGRPRCREGLFEGSGNELADTNGEGLERDGRPRQEEQPEATRTIPFYPPGPNEYERWSQLLTIMPKVEPAFCRDADGTPSWVDRRLRATGNGVVPSMAAYAWLYLGRDDKEVLMNAMST
jgi:DNA (cytosine-5)-methyltransferase 1